MYLYTKIKFVHIYIDVYILEVRIALRVTAEVKVTGWQ